MKKPTPREPKASDRPPIPLPDPDEVRHTFEVAMAKVRERQGFYTALAIIALLVAVGAIFALNLGPRPTPGGFAGLWKRAQRVREKLVVDRSARAELAELAAYLDEVRGSPTEGHALWLLGIYHYREAWTADKTTADDRRPDIEKAVKYLEQLDEARFDDLLLAKPRWFNDSGTPPTTALLKQVREDLAWLDENVYAEPLPNPAVVAVLRTELGDVHLQFFSDLSPEHTRNFITLARKGTYNGTRFHFVRKDPTSPQGQPRGVMAGDPYSFFYNDPLNEKHILRWGKGGVGYEIAPEPGRHRISHRRGVMTSLMPGRSDWDNGVQFMIITGIDLDLDKRHTPFAKVVEGMGIVDKIAARKTAGEHPSYRDDYDFQTTETRDLLVEPVTIHKVIVYEDGRAMEHDFPLEEGEKRLAALSQTPVKPLTGDALIAGRKLRPADAPGEIRLGLDIPMPEDAKEG